MVFRAKILEKIALMEVTPLALRTYAISEGWVKSSSYGDHSDIYVRENSEIILPGNASLADYANVVSEIITRFAVIESRDELQIYRDLTAADNDVVRVRAPEAKKDGSIPIAEGVGLFVNARNLLQAAACSAAQPRAAYRAGGVKAATTYLEKVRLGQTERGSFVVTLVSPVPPSLESNQQQAFWPLPENEPFERKVTRCLADGLQAAKDAVEKTNRGDLIGAFERAVILGVSANLCEAAAALIGLGDGLDVSITWAKTRTTPEPMRRIEFTPADGAVLSEAGRLLREKEPRDNEEVRGVVVDLRREPDDVIGTAILRAFVDEKLVSVRVNLPELIYQRALVAHGDRQAISLKGELIREGQRWRLINPRDFRILSPDED